MSLIQLTAFLAKCYWIENDQIILELAERIHLYKIYERMIKIKALTPAHTILPTSFVVY